MNWFKQVYKSLVTRPATRVKSLMGAVRAALGGAFSGSWVTDHREEAKHFTGFNYIAIHAIACQVSGATVTAFSDGSQQFGRQMKRKALRKAHGTFSKYKSTYGMEDKETDPLPPTHPLMKILKKPNPYENGASFRYRQAQQLRLTGTCYVWNVPSVYKNADAPLGVPCQRFVIPTAMATPTQPTADMPLGGLRVQPNVSRYIPLEDQGFVEGWPTWTALLNQTVDMRQIQKICYPHAYYMDDGQSPISAGAKWVDGAEAVDSARTSQLRNGVDPSIQVELPADVDPSQDEIDVFTKKLADKYGGVDNIGRVMVTQNGAKVTPLSTNPKDMSYSEGFQDFKSANLALHQTPPVAVGIQEPGAYAAYYASMKAWRHSAVQPLCDMLAESDTEHLAPLFGQGLTVEIESDEIDDSDQTEKMLANDLQAGIRTLNEWRTLRGLPPDPTPAGDEYVKPSKSASGDKSDGSGSPNDPQSSPPSYPRTPLGQSKALRAAIKAAEEGDIAQLVSCLKSYSPSEPRDSDGKWTTGGGSARRASEIARDMTDEAERGKTSHESAADQHEHAAKLIKESGGDKEKIEHHTEMARYHRQMESRARASSSGKRCNALPHEQTVAEYAKSGAVAYRTAQGSVYSHKNGKTVRVKTPHAGHESKDIGLKNQSEETHYVSPEDAKEIGMWQSLQAKGKRIIRKGDQLLLTSLNVASGKRGIDGRITIQSASPKVGLAPVELFDPSSQGEGWFRGNHPGNAITEMVPLREAHKVFTDAAKKKASKSRVARRTNGYRHDLEELIGVN